MRTLLILVVVVIGQQGAPSTPALTAALDGVRAERLMAHVTTLASDTFEGRGPGTPGETRTVNYLSTLCSQSRRRSPISISTAGTSGARRPI
jgi:hypothetical protein